jgi:hypothetical protein
MAKKATRPGSRENVFKATFTRFANKRGSRGRARFGDWRKILMHRFAPGSETPNPVSLAIFAIDRVGPAAVRACASGLKSVSRHRTKRPQRYFAPRLPKPLGGAPPIS